MQQLQVQNAEFQTLVGEGNRRVTTAQAEKTRARRERDAYQQTWREARDKVDTLRGKLFGTGCGTTVDYSSVVAAANAEAPLKLATAAAIVP